MWFSAVAAYLSHGTTDCAFGDAFLLATVNKSGYLSYCILPVVSNRSPLTSLINKGFPPIERFTAVSEIFKPDHLAPATISWSNQYDHIFPSF